MRRSLPGGAGPCADSLRPSEGTTWAAACDSEELRLGAEGKLPAEAVGSAVGGKGLVGEVAAGSKVGFGAVGWCCGLAAAAAASVETNGVVLGALLGSAAISMRPSAPLLALTVLLALGWRETGKGRVTSLLGWP